MSRAHAFRSVLLIVSLLITIPVFAQEPGNLPQGLAPHETTAFPGGGCYQIVQSQALRDDVFQLNRCNGDVHRLYKTSLGLRWRLITRPTWEEALFPRDAGSDSVTPRFVLFLSGWGINDTYLYDTKTDLSWELVIDIPNNLLKWELIPHSPQAAPVLE